MWFCFRGIRLHIVVHHSKRHFHGNLTAGKFGISGQRETSACPGLKNEPAFQAEKYNAPEEKSNAYMPQSMRAASSEKPQDKNGDM